MKDAYYFSHDCNAKEDPKCVLLIEQLGLEGYGIFWVLVETLREQPEFKYPINLIPALARKYNTSAEKMKSVIFSYGLFEIENDKFFLSDFENLVNMKEATKLFKSSPPTIRKYAKLGYYKEYRFLGKLVYYDRREILAFILNKNFKK